MSDLLHERSVITPGTTYLSRHWEPDNAGLPTQRVIDPRRPAEFITPIPKPKKRKTPKQDEARGDEQSVS